MSTPTAWTARTLAIAVLTTAGVAALSNPAPAQVGGFNPNGRPLRNSLPPRKPGANTVRPPSPGGVQTSPGISGVPSPFAYPYVPPPPVNLGFITLEPPPEPPAVGPAAPSSGSGFQFNPGWGLASPSSFGQPLSPAALLPGQQTKWSETVLQTAGEMVVERDGSRFYRVAGSELFYSPIARTYLNPQTGVISRPSVMW